MATQLQNDANGNSETEPLYRWVYRPELQLSQYNFDAKSLIVNQLDEDGTESTTDIKIEEDEADFGPIFDDYTDSVELLFDLLGPELDRLPALENDREFVLSLGGEEAITTIGADGKVIFENPEHLNLLTEEDLLSLRLYLNGDAGNVLWEYHMAGFGPFWSIYPNQQPHAIRKPNSPVNASAETVTAADGDSYYMLGGMRIKVLFQTEQDSSLGEALSVTWKVEDASGSLLSDNIGNFYPDNNPVSNSLGKTYNVSSATNPDEALFETYYQPEQWRTDLDVKITAQVRYSRQSTPKNYSISLKSRELYPVSTDNPNIYNSEDSQAPLKGSDVAMLEGLLWQLGISPQRSSPGQLGSRIKSTRYIDGAGNPVVTSSCVVGQSHARYVFLSDNNNDQDCASHELMLKRFQSRNNNNYFVTMTEINSQTGVLDQDTLNALSRDWGFYRTAAYDHSRPVITRDDNAVEGGERLFDQWVAGATAVWEDGIGNTIPATYTQAIHNDIMSENGISDVSRADLLNAWISEESSFHWGTNAGRSGGLPNQPSDYRMLVGGDEHGSLSFSQLVYPLRFGPNACDSQVQADLTHMIQLNRYKSLHCIPLLMGTVLVE